MLVSLLLTMEEHGGALTLDLRNCRAAAAEFAEIEQANRVLCDAHARKALDDEIRCVSGFLSMHAMHCHNSGHNAGPRHSTQISVRARTAASARCERTLKGERSRYVC
jgi:hypothetical protein